MSQSSNDKGISHTRSKTRKKLLEPDEVRRLDDGKTLIIAHNRLPVTDEQNIYYRQDKYMRNII
jgi:type IV secretory pathway TraG/TraD family ATPase VirD4